MLLKRMVNAHSAATTLEFDAICHINVALITFMRARNCFRHKTMENVTFVCDMA
jgi:hypothetical protein